MIYTFANAIYFYDFLFLLMQKNIKHEFFDDAAPCHVSFKQIESRWWRESFKICDLFIDPKLLLQTDNTNADYISLILVTNNKI